MGYANDEKNHGGKNFRDKFFRYGVNKAQFEKMYDAQRGYCAICGMEKAICIDHCHDTGKVRGLLCHGCNTSIGKLKDNPRIILSAFYYVLNKGVKYED